MIRMVSTLITGCNQCPFLGINQRGYLNFDTECSLLGFVAHCRDYVSEQKELEEWFEKKCMLEKQL